MPTCRNVARPLSRCIAQPHSTRISRRAFVVCSSHKSDLSIERLTTKYDPITVTDPRGERRLMRAGIQPIGSRRRRAAIKTSGGLPFEQLPYQCFQAARKVLLADREEKLLQIGNERAKITRLSQQDPSTVQGGARMKDIRLESMRKNLEKLKILADVNDPLIKKKFEDGEGDMTKPIYRYLARKKWDAYQRRIIVQRLHQLHVVPDCLPHFEPSADVRMTFKRRNVQPGDFVDSTVSEKPVRLNVQVFDKSERLVTIIVVDSDVPDLERDAFTSRLHFMAANIPLTPAETSLPLSQVSSEAQLIHSWLPPFAQKGSPYHRFSIFVLQQQPGSILDTNTLKEKIKRDGFSLKSFVGKFGVVPIGFNIFRAIWDERTADLMNRHGIEGADIEFKRTRISALKPKEKARGWEARHASSKYRSIRR